MLLLTGCSLHVRWIASEQNPADKPSRARPESTAVGTCCPRSPASPRRDARRETGGLFDREKAEQDFYDALDQFLANEDDGDPDIVTNIRIDLDFENVPDGEDAPELQRARSRTPSERLGAPADPGGSACGADREPPSPRSAPTISPRTGGGNQQLTGSHVPRAEPGPTDHRDQLQRTRRGFPEVGRASADAARRREASRQRVVRVLRAPLLRGVQPRRRGQAHRVLEVQLAAPHQRRANASTPCACCPPRFPTST